MSLERDLQSHVRLLAEEAITVTAAGTPGNFDSTQVVDTKGFRGVVFGVSLSRAIGADDITFVVLESDTSGGTYTAIDTDKYLPTSDTVRALDDAGAAGNLQTFGVIQTKQYLKVRLTSTTAGTDITATILTALLGENLAVDVTGIDGLP